MEAVLLQLLVVDVEPVLISFGLVQKVEKMQHLLSFSSCLSTWYVCFLRFVCLLPCDHPPSPKQPEQRQPTSHLAFFPFLLSFAHLFLKQLRTRFVWTTYKVLYILSGYTLSSKSVSLSLTWTFAGEIQSLEEYVVPGNQYPLYIFILSTAFIFLRFIIFPLLLLWSKNICVIL